MPEKRGSLWPALPGLCWLTVFLVAPLMVIAAISVARRTPPPFELVWPPSWESYRRAFSPTLLRGPLWNSLWLALATTGLCLALAYPLAWVLARARGAARHALFLLVVLPFFTNFLVRVYAWFVLLRPAGPAAGVLRALGLDAPLLGSPAGVLVGLVYGYLPFMILPLFSSMERIDPALLEAARDLGASPLRVFRRVVLPLSLPGAAAGCLLVFVPVLGEFVVPRLLGGGKVPMIGTVIEDQFLGRVRPNWPLGSALALLLVGAVALALLPRLALRREDPWAR
jgi:spermidine/putrescine transport system permease protein